MFIWSHPKFIVCLFVTAWYSGLGNNWVITRILRLWTITWFVIQTTFRLSSMVLPKKTWLLGSLEYLKVCRVYRKNTWECMMNVNEEMCPLILYKWSMIHVSHFNTEDPCKVWSIRSWCFISDVMLILLLLDLSCRLQLVSPEYSYHLQLLILFGKKDQMLLPLGKAALVAERNSSQMHSWK